MKFVHKIKTNDFLNQNNLFTTNSYLGIKFQLESQSYINDIGIFMRTKLPYGFEHVNVEIKIGIINNNGNMCNIYKLIHCYKYGDINALGNKKFTTKDRVKKYEINGFINLVYEIVKCDYEKSQMKMIQRIYQQICKDENEAISSIGS